MKAKLFLWKTVLKFLALVGIVSSFSSCDPNDFSAKYGAPAEEYNEINFSGSVLSEDSLKAIPAVRVTLIDQYNHDSIYTTSNSSGNFTLYKDAFADKNFTIRFKITDPVQSHGNFIGKKIDFVTNFRDINNKEKVINVQLKKQ